MRGDLGQSIVMKLIRTVGSVILAWSFALNVAAQTFPAKAVRMIVPYAPGGSVDVLARMVAPKLAESMGQQVVVDNRPGAAGNIGTELAVRAPEVAERLAREGIDIATGFLAAKRALAP